MKRLPSASHRYAPSPREKKRGVPPPERKARTGELTPAGSVRGARATLGRGVARGADDRRASETLPRPRERRVLAAKMHAVSVDGVGEIDIVVDDEDRIRAAA